MVPMLWHSAETPNPGTMAWSAQTQEGKICRVPYFWRILFHGARNRGLSDLFERWIRKPHPRNESSKYAPTESFGGQITSPLLLAIALYFLPMVPMLWHSAETPNTGTMAWSAQTHGGKIYFFFTIHNILHTLKKEPLNIMLLHTSRRMDGPWIKTVHVVSRIFDTSSSRGLESRAIWPVGKMNKKTTP